ncbi:hypothetical protein FUAX_33510 [Fulvitalea axinellae]|uniref:Septum formation initiator family protein n=2 Tax=Fulvitalea axinellae TaxID=1182444 RepID=A0AAU9CFH0_9BACT|nr:hypothetical protein FUAX_33510 [Fulvitalea axinellae]
MKAPAFCRGFFYFGRNLNLCRWPELARIFNAMMKLLKTYGRKLIRNFYLVVGLAFLVWMSVFDTNNWLNQYRLRSKLEKLKEEEVYYLEQIEVVQKDRQELLSNKRSIEKFAREKYLMKKPSEDLFVIEYKK